jgi:hypothetical protein
LIPAVTAAWLASDASAQMIYEPFDYGASSVGTALEGRSRRTTRLCEHHERRDLVGGVYQQCDRDHDGGEDSLRQPDARRPAGVDGEQRRKEPARADAKPAHRAGNHRRIHRAGTTLYYSFLLNITDTTNIRPNTDLQGVILAGFNNTIGTQAAQPGVLASRLQIREGTVAGTTYQLGIRSNSTARWYGGRTSRWTASVRRRRLPDRRGLGGADDVQSLWINPSADYGAANAPATALTTTGGDITTTQIASFLIRDFNQSTGVGAPQGIQIDDIRVDQSWGQVTMPVGTRVGGGSGNWSAGLPDAVNSFVNFNAGGGNVTVDGGGKTVGTITIQQLRALRDLRLAPDHERRRVRQHVHRDQRHPADGRRQRHPADRQPLHRLQHHAGQQPRGEHRREPDADAVGVVSGTGIINKNGGGVLALAGANTFDSAGAREHHHQRRDRQRASDAALGPAPGSPTTKINNNRGVLRLDGSFATHVNRNLVNAGGSANSIPEPFLCQMEVTAGNTATFGGVISGGAMMKIGPGSLVLGNGANSYSANIIAAGTLVAPDNANLGNSAGPVTFSGGILKTTGSFTSTRALTITAGGSGTVDTAANDVTFGNISGSGSFTKTGAGTLTTGASGGTAPRLTTAAGNLTVSGGTLQIAAGGQANGVAVVNTTAVSGGGRLDINDNHLIDHNTGVGSATGGVYNGVSGLIQSGRNGGGWTGSGIVTSQSNATSGNFTSIGVATAQQVKSLASATDTATWAGQPSPARTTWSCTRTAATPTWTGRSTSTTTDASTST